MIPFNNPNVPGNTLSYLKTILESKKFSGDGEFNKRCELFLKKMVRTDGVLLTPSATQALEMASLLINVQSGDEIIMPSFTFTSTATAFVLRGAKIIFIDIRPDTMNMDEDLIEDAISDRTRAIIPVHYAGVPCEMDKIMKIAERYGLYVIEDAAQAIYSTYKNTQAGTIGHLGVFSFHETKNIHCGEGGALLINDPRFKERAEIIKEKGTNRSKFYRGEIDRYSWVDIGSSFLLSELNAALLYAQLISIDEIILNRIHTWELYYERLSHLQDYIGLPVVPNTSTHNGHNFYIKTSDSIDRSNLIKHLKKNGIQAVFHYVPLHSSPAGKKYSSFQGEDRYTTTESERLLRLPNYYKFPEENIIRVVKAIEEFFI